MFKKHLIFLIFYIIAAASNALLSQICRSTMVDWSNNFFYWIFWDQINAIRNLFFCCKLWTCHL